MTRCLPAAERPALNLLLILQFLSSTAPHISLHQVEVPSQIPRTSTPSPPGGSSVTRNLSQSNSPPPAPLSNSRAEAFFCRSPPAETEQSKTFLGLLSSFLDLLSELLLSWASRPFLDLQTRLNPTSTVPPTHPSQNQRRWNFPLLDFNGSSQAKKTLMALIGWWSGE